MADKHYSVQIKRGTQAELDLVPNLLPGELVWTTDTKALYIGTADGNQKLTSNSEVFAYLNDKNITLGDLLDSWKGNLQEMHDVIVEGLSAGFSAQPYYLDNMNNPEAIRTGVIYVDDKTDNLPADFAV